MANSQDPLLQWLSNAGSLGILAAACVAFIRGWIVPGPTHMRILARLDRANDLAERRPRVHRTRAQNAGEASRRRAISRRPSGGSSWTLSPAPFDASRYSSSASSCSSPPRRGSAPIASSRPSRTSGSWRRSSRRGCAPAASSRTALTLWPRDSRASPASRVRSGYEGCEAQQAQQAQQAQRGTLVPPEPRVQRGRRVPRVREVQQGRLGHGVPLARRARLGLRGRMVVAHLDRPALRGHRGHQARRGHPARLDAGHHRGHPVDDLRSARYAHVTTQPKEARWLTP